MSVKSNIGVVTDGLVFYVDAGNGDSYAGSGTTWSDLMGTTNGSLVGAPTYSSDNGGSMVFDGTDDRVDINNTTLISNTAYTKVAWFRPTALTRNIISGGNTQRHAFWMAATDHSLYAGHNGAWTTVGHRPNDPGNMLNQWWCGAVTFDSTSGWVLYLNGQQVSTSTSTSAPSGGEKVHIGAYANGNLFNGDIPVAMIYDRALSAAEITQNYNALKNRFI